ncbi:CbtA family protein, partial [Tsukamurella sp. 8J]
MEGRIIARGVLAGALGGLLAFVFARIFAEPVISRAIDYESARDEAKASVMHMHMEDGPDIFSRTIQANIGIGVGIIAVGCAMGALFAVVYCVAAPHVARMEPRRLALAIAASMFVGVYLLPYLKYPANPPAIGNPDTIKERGGLYLLMVAISVALVWIAWIAGLTLAPRIGA